MTVVVAAAREMLASIGVTVTVSVVPYCVTVFAAGMAVIATVVIDLILWRVLAFVVNSVAFLTVSLTVDPAASLSSGLEGGDLIHTVVLGVAFVSIVLQDAFS